MSTDATPAASQANPYVALQVTPDFQRLRRTFRRFVFPMTALFLAWYLIYVLLSIFASDFMGIKVFGNINVGLLFGLGQFVSTFAITFIYARWASSRFDPLADKLSVELDALVGNQPNTGTAQRSEAKEN